MPIIKSVLLNATDEGLTLTATDLEISITSDIIDCEIVSKGSVAIDAKMFSDIVSKMIDEFVSIKSDDLNAVTIRSGRRVLTIPGISGDEFPVVSIDTIANQIAGVPEMLLHSLLKGTLFSVAVESSKDILTGLLFSIQDDSLSLVSTDGYRVSKKTLPFTTGFASEIVIPGNSAAKILKALNVKSYDPVDIGITENHMIFKANNFTITTRIKDGEFINFRKFFEYSKPTQILIGAKEFLSSLECLKIIAADSRNRIILNQNERNIIMKVDGQTGNAYDEIEASISGEPVTIAFNIDYLISVVKTIGESNVKIGLSDSRSACFISVEEEVIRSDYLILPLRLKETA